MNLQKSGKEGSSPPRKTVTTPLTDLFDQLPAIEKRVLQLLSILFEFVNRTNLATYLRESGVKGENGKPLTTMALKPIIEKLDRMGLAEINRHASNQFRCSDDVAEYATRSALADGQFTGMAKVVQKQLPPIPSYYSYSNKMSGFERGWREIRIGIYAHDVEHVQKYLKLCQEQFPEEMSRNQPLATICGSNFDAEWFRDLPPEIQTSALDEMLPPMLSDFESVSEILPLLQEYERLDLGENNFLFRKALVTILIFQGNLAEAQTILDSREGVADGVTLQGWLHFLRGENEEAIRCFEAGLAALRKLTRKRKTFFPDLSGLFYLLALLKSGNISQQKRIGEFLEITRKRKIMNTIPAYRAIEAVLLAQGNKVDRALTLLEGGFHMEDFFSIRMNAEVFRAKFESARSEEESRLTKLFKMMARLWIDVEHARKHKHGMKALCETARKNGYLWAAMEAAALLSSLDEEDKKHADLASSIQVSSGMKSVISIVSREERWERALKVLVQMGSDPGKSSAKAFSKSRLVWMIKLYGGHVNIRPREQVRSSAGNWSKGRPVALKRLAGDPGKMEFLTDQDRRICTAIVRDSDYYGGTTYEFDENRAVLAMVGHPLVFWEDSPKINVEIVKTEPELSVRQRGGTISVRFNGNIGNQGVVIAKETPTRIKVTEVTPAHKQIVDVLGEKGLQVPTAGKQRVLEAIQALSSMVTIHSGIGGGTENIREIPADPRPHVHLLPMGDGLKVNLLVRPFTNDGPYFQPGKGGQTIISEINGERIQASRDLRKEKSQAELAVNKCQTLAGASNGQNDWTIDEPEECLDLLLEMQALGEQVVVEWPEGEKLRVSRPVSMDSMRVKIQKDNDWFSLTGELRLDESLMLEMGQLLDLARNKESRFIPLGEGQFIALTETFRRRLAEIDAFSEKSAKGRRFHPLASLLLQDLTDEAGSFTADKHWKTHLQHIQKSQELEPTVPSTLQADLRDYQVEGFQWLSRLASWGVGACLADDMGLGKTMQALGLILSKASEGPSLVMAPTSVCLNWQGEIERFAPTLNGISFGGSRRQETLDGLKPFDVLICSYGLLQQETEMLSAVNWNVIVLDEAQAIKNRMTKRSKAAMALSGSFKMITTGTPIENHLGELWNLFRFLNPGLLGSLERFNERFAAPIERHGEKNAGKRLKKLIQPFLLRRTKSQVLEELPPRTEIVLHVEMSPEETAFYETLRQRAVEQIENLQGPVEQNHLQILAEIMRLRRACCNSRLVIPDSPVESTKLALFQEVVEELLDNRHKALVFSQFVDHLAIIRESLDKSGIAYQYLDGSTPAKERKRRVDAFQAGEGDLFLISLKAGGLGINLTAADYVIHMDPWWNPAVEDQASDRAHRIGQKRPVTIYRLVTKETIEEKIVDLHRHKRDLADGLLEGGDMSGKMSTKDLLRLIRGQT
ncbi:MAG: DEAD/DEAH box helicase [Magnetococcales bacterium]|nr:DEAD/DEAH box helicase [Magnetococcales bacterium]